MNMIKTEILFSFVISAIFSSCHIDVIEFLERISTEFTRIDWQTTTSTQWNYVGFQIQPKTFQWIESIKLT